MAAILKSKMVAIHYFNKVIDGVFELIGIANGVKPPKWTSCDIHNSCYSVN